MQRKVLLSGGSEENKGKSFQMTVKEREGLRDVREGERYRDWQMNGGTEKGVDNTNWTEEEEQEAEAHSFSQKCRTCVARTASGKKAKKGHWKAIGKVTLYPRYQGGEKK